MTQELSHHLEHQRSIQIQSRSQSCQCKLIQGYNLLYICKDCLYFLKYKCLRQSLFDVQIFLHSYVNHLLKTKLNSFFKKIFIYFWLHWVSVAACGIFHCGVWASLQLWCIGSRACGLCSCGTWPLQLRCAGLVAPWHMGSQFPNEGSNLCPRHWKADS